MALAMLTTVVLVLRISELRRLAVQHISADWVVIPLSKGDRRHQGDKVHISQFARPVTDYLKNLGRNPAADIPYSFFNQWLRPRLARAGITYCTWHVLRHVAATFLYSEGFAVSSVQWYGRWKVEAGALRYIHVNMGSGVLPMSGLKGLVV